MGAVWLGQDTVLGREVALKRIGVMPGANRPDLERAEREARLAARLNHPHVVGVFDLVTEGEETWLVMEHVEGVTLAALVERDGALAPPEAAQLVCQAADALAAAHAAGIIHRDVKPSNMLVTPQGEVKLTDFGIARAQADASLTQTGLVTGSPAYLAPEVASGATADEASDVWSLGTTLYHLLAGHPPYDVTENLMGSLYRIVHEEPPRLDEPGRLRPVLEHTMARDPSDRWSMAEVRDFLSRGPEVTIHPAPFGAVESDRTRMLRPTAAVPVAVPPVDRDPSLDPGAANRTEPDRARRRLPVWPWVVAAAALVAVGLLGFAALTADHGGGATSSRAGTGATGSGPSTSPTTPRASGASDTRTTGTSPSRNQAARMRQFITTYLARVTQDDHTTFQMLTPGFQDTSGRYGGYHGFWKTIATASPRNVEADPAAMTVTYDVDYLKQDGTTSNSHVTLRLVKQGQTYLIAGES
jgi:serine/threonine protein kinase